MIIYVIIVLKKGSIKVQKFFLIVFTNKYKKSCEQDYLCDTTLLAHFCKFVQYLHITLHILPFNDYIIYRHKNMRLIEKKRQWRLSMIYKVALFPIY